MGCGCAKSTTTSAQRVSTDQTLPLSLQRGGTEDHRGDSNLFKEESVSRFTRKSEYVDFFDRGERPERNRSMLDVYAHSDMNTLEDQGKPKTTLQLDYVYGYRCFQAKQNVFYTGLSDTVAYPAAALVVLLNTGSNTQSFLGGGELVAAQGHSDDIVAMAVSKGKDLIATGEIGRNPLICVWKLEQPDRGVEIRKLEQGLNTRAVAALCFSEDCKQLIAVDQAQTQVIRVYDWKESLTPTHILVVSKGRVWSVRFSPKGSLFCAVGKEHFSFWTLKGHEFAKHKPGSMDTSANMNVVQWLSNGNCVTGGSDGQLYLWIDKNLKKKYAVFEGCEILALAIVSDVIVLGGAGLTIRVLNATFKEVGRYQVPDWVMSVDKSGDNILCSTRNGIIQELTGNSRLVLMESHCEREVWSLAVSPNDWRIIISAGDDNKIKSWDLVQRRCVSTCILESAEVERPHRSSFLPQGQQSRALAISPKGHVAVAHNDGRISIRNNIHQLNIILKLLPEPRDWIQTLQYSPKGSALAAGSMDRCIYVYDVSAGYSLFHKLGGLGKVVGLDWSVEEHMIRGADEEGRVKVWEVQSEASVEELGSEQWATWTCAVGQPVQGINQLTSDPAFVTCVSRSLDSKHFAVGNAWGLLEIYDNPNGPGSKSNVYRGHSLEVENALWVRQDRVLLTAGGPDLTIMQWRVSEK